MQEGCNRRTKQIIKTIMKALFEEKYEKFDFNKRYRKQTNKQTKKRQITRYRFCRNRIVWPQPLGCRSMSFLLHICILL